PAGPAAVQRVAETARRLRDRRRIDLVCAEKPVAISKLKPALAGVFMVQALSLTLVQLSQQHRSLEFITQASQSLEECQILGLRDIAHMQLHRVRIEQEV